MPKLKKIVLDVLKPHLPNALDFTRGIAALGTDYRVSLDVVEVDEKTETTVIVVEGEDLDFSAIEQVVNEMGGSIHSIDKVNMDGDGESPPAA
jgi:hypothetical protein